MDFERVLNLGVEKEIIDETQKNSLIDLFYQNENEPKQASAVVKVFYYIGGFIMLCAMTSLMSNTVQHSTYTMILLLGAIYAGVLYNKNFDKIRSLIESKLSEKIRKFLPQNRV